MDAHVESRNHSPTSELTKRFVIALIATGLLLLTGQALIEIRLKNDIDEINDISDAGRLQTTSQAIARTVLQLRIAPPAEEQEHLLDKLQEDIHTIEQQASSLRLDASPPERNRETQPAVARMLDSIEPARRDMITSARNIYRAFAEHQGRDPLPDIDAFFRHNLAFTAGMEDVVRLIIAHNSEQMQWLRVAQLSLLGIVMIIAALSSLYVFRPALQKIRQTIRNMQQTQDTLQQSEERFTKIFRSAPLAISISSFQEGTLLAVNTAFEELSGYTSGELAGRTTLFAALRISEDDQKKIRRTISERGAASNLDITFWRRDNSVRHAVLSAESMTLDGKTSLITTIKDLTEHTVASRELKQKETHFRSLIEHSNDIIAVISPEGTIRHCSQSVQRILGYDPELIIGRSLFDFVYSDDRQVVVQLIGNVQAQPNLVLQLSDFQMLRSNGTLAHFETIASNLLDNPAVEGIVVNARDTSDRVAAAAEIRHSREQFAMMFRTAPVAICITSLVDSRFMDINEAYAELTGYSREELIGKTVDDIRLQPSTARRASRRMATEMHAVRNFETEITTKDGRQRFILTSLDHVEFNGERCVFSLSIDVTELKQIREALGQSEDRFARIFHTSPAAISITTLDGHFVDANDSLCEMLGCSRSEIVGSTSAELGLADSETGQRLHEAFIERLRQEGRIQRRESTFLDRNGNRRYYLNSSDIIRLDGGEHVLNIGMDITELKQAEQLQKEYEERFSTVFHASPAGICITTLAEGRFVEVNDEYCAMLGCSREELLGRTSVNISVITQEYHSSIIAGLNTTGLLKRRELEMIGKDGKKGWYLASIDQINLNGEAHLVSILIDISDLKRAEEMRSQLEERFSKVFYASPIPILITTEQEGNIVDANDSYVQLSGYTREELLDKNLIDLDLITYSDNRDNLLRELSHKQSLAGVQGTIHTRSGDMRRLLVSVERIRLGGVSHLLKMAIDITESVHAANALADSERKFRSLFDVAAVGIGLVDTNGTWLLVNQKLCEIMGYECEEFYTPGFHRLTHPDDLSLDNEFVRRLMNKEIGEFSLEKRYVRKDGVAIWGRVTASVVRDANDTPQYFIRIVQDITDQKANLEALKRSEEKFSRVFHAAPLGVFIATGDSHQLIEVNESFEKLTGYAHGELIGKTAAELGIITLQDISVSLSHREQEHRHNVESRLRTKAGGERIVLVSVEPVLIDNRECLISMVLDITEIRRTPELLQQQEAYFQSLIEHSSDVVLVLGRDTRIRYASPSCERQLGYPRQELTGSADLPFVHPDDLAAVEHILLDTLRTSTVGSLECFRVVRRDGEVRFFELLLTDLTQTTHIEGTVLTCRDITERVRAEQELTEAHLRLRATFEQSAIGIAHLDIEGRWLRVNRKVCDITGFSREELLTRTSQDITFADDIETDVRMAYQLATGEIPSYIINKRYVRSDGSLVWTQLTCSAVHDDTGQFRFFIAFIEDISRYQDSEKAHRESNQRFYSLADAIPVMLWMSDSSARHTFFNKSWLEFTGRPLHEELDKGWARGIHPDDFDRCRHIYSTSFDARLEFQIEYRLLRRDHQYRVVLNHGVPRYLPDGNFDGYIGTCIDITAIRMAAAERTDGADTEDIQRQVQSAYLANIGQEIRSPLHSIMGFAYLLGQEATSDEHRLYAQTIHNSARFLTNVLNNIVLLSHIESSDFGHMPTELVLQNEVRLAIDSVQEEAREKGLTIHYQSVEERIVLSADQRLLARMIENLLQNAVKFTDKGTIRVQIEKENYEHTAVGVITIEDTGVGIAPEFLPLVFDHYTQELGDTERKHEGVGLGLTVVKKIAELMNATVQVRSVHHSGSVFTVRIPLEDTVV